MTSLIKFELGKILRNRTVFGGIVVGCLVLLGIFFVGYHYSQLSMSEDRLNENINSIYAMIDSLSEEELFKPHMRKWADEATKTAVWEVYKFIHVNTVAPFGTFRTKIRKWKKIAL